MLIINALPAIEVNTISLHLYLATMKKAEAPSVREGFAIFSVNGPYRYVGAAFKHENWNIIHPFQRNKPGVFVLALPVPRDRSEPLEYRLVIDGIWTKDPSNSLFIRDTRTGLDFSVLSIPFISSEDMDNYKLIEGDKNKIKFLYRDDPGKIVTVVGDFNNWDPFIHELAEVSPGLYRLEMELPPGRYGYAFFCDGEKAIDHLNPDSAYNKAGEMISIISIPGF